MTKCEYLTARCPFGCEVWLHPKAVRSHFSRCRGHRWTDDRRPATEVLLADDKADAARRICPPELLSTPMFSDDRVLNPRPGMYLHFGLGQAVVVASPIRGISGRRWAGVILAAAESNRNVAGALTLVGFYKLENDLGLAGALDVCDICGDDIPARSLRLHQRMNSVCRFIADTDSVRRLQREGYADPYSIMCEAVPLTWTGLNKRVCWKRRLHIVKFRLWTAVLLAPSLGDSEHVPEQTHSTGAHRNPAAIAGLHAGSVASSLAGVTGEDTHRHGGFWR